MINRKGLLAAMVAAAGAAALALAQDSVSNLDLQPAGASDALSPWDVALQSEEYVVHTAPILSSWGTRYAVAPLLKSSKTEAAFENSLISAQAISRMYASGVLKNVYEIWNGRELGVHPTNNDPAGSTAPDFVSKQFGAAFAEFAGVGINNVISAVVNVCRNDPNTLYVNRIVAATNGLVAADNSAQVGVGAVDGEGNVAIRADGVGAVGPAITNVNIICIDSKGRNLGVVNRLQSVAGVNSSLDPGATTYPIINQVSSPTNQFSTPNLIPAELCGMKSYIGTNFNNQYVFDNGASVTGAHLVAPLTNTRGSLAFSAVPLLGRVGAVASGATLAKPGAAANTTGFAIWDIDCTSAVLAPPLALVAPAAISDPCYARTIGMATKEFDHYHSQVAFRGGNSQIALGRDKAGNPLAVAEVNEVSTTPAFITENQLAAVRVTPGGPQWSLVAWNGDFNFVFSGLGRGKPVLDGPGGNEIGYIATIMELTNADTLGPSLSAPSIDSVGNVWFVAPVWYPPSLPVMDADFVDPLDCHTTLLRAVLREGPGGAPCWDLEKVIGNGDIIAGDDSKTNYRVGFIEIADSNSVSSGGFWSQNVMQQAFWGQTPSLLAQASNRTTGGVLLSCSITYDRNNDGVFSATSEIAGDADEEYSVILYVGPDAPTCPSNINGDAVVDTADLGLVLGQVGTSGPNADLNCDGVVDTADLGLLLGDFGDSGCE